MEREGVSTRAASGETPDTTRETRVLPNEEESTPHPALAGSESAAPHPSFGHLLPRVEQGSSPGEAERVATDDGQTSRGI